MSVHVAGAFFLCIWRCCNVKILLNIRRVCGGSDAGAVEVLYAREAKEQENPAQFLAEKEAEYTKLFANPYLS